MKNIKFSLNRAVESLLGLCRAKAESASFRLGGLSAAVSDAQGRALSTFSIRTLKGAATRGQSYRFAATVIFIAWLLLGTVPNRVFGGNLDSPGALGATMKTVTDIRNRISSGTAAGSHTLQPAGAPGSTGYTMEEIYNALPAGSTTTIAEADVKTGKTFIKRNGGQMTFSTGTMATVALAAGANSYPAGYHAGEASLTAVDADLAEENIASGVTIFGVAGTMTGGCVPDTGQTTSYGTGDDADYNPTGTQPSYTDNGDGTTTDNRTGLMWLKDDNNYNSGGTQAWTAALSGCESFTYATYTDWRLPNANELFSIVEQEGTAPFINATYFPNTESNYYWTSTTYVPATTYALGVVFNVGGVYYTNKTNAYSVRPVRGGP